MSHTRNSSSSSSSTAINSPIDLPDGHPHVEPHDHTMGKICPLLHGRRTATDFESAVDEHAYCPPQTTDVRAVCPALNCMANHGYISRDGRNLTFNDIYSGLKECFGLSSVLAFVLTLGGFLLIKRSPIRLPSWIPFFGKATNPDGTVSPAGVLDLYHVGLHGGVEHDASLVHRGTEPGQLYPPTEIVEPWVGNLVGDVQPPVYGYNEIDEKVGMKAHISTWRFFATEKYEATLVSAADVGRMRVRREQEILPKKLDGVHAEIARGEMAIVLGMWDTMVSVGGEQKSGVPLPWLLTFLAEERLPEDGKWRPSHVQGLLDVVRRSSAIRATQNGQ